MATRPRKALIIGGGPVGALTALSLHKRGWQVEVWEGRDDPRAEDVSPFTLRSINLAISARGLAALRSVDPSLAEDFLEQAIPMKGRMIHHVDGKQESQLYDPKDGQYINSISRPLLNQRLLLALPSDIALKFNRKLTRIDFKARRAYGKATSNTIKPGEEAGDKPVRGEKQEEEEHGTQFDLVIGCDGSWSKVRTEMMRVERMDFKQSFIPHAYIELHMPASDKAADPYRIDKNHLHIWPRHSFMLIGLPNAGGSFTLTLFAPFKELEALDTRDKALAFFKTHFPSALKLVGEQVILDDFANNPRGSLVTINASPSNYGAAGLVLGDASHSMVPFYGQGLNCGLEDVRVLNSFLEKHHVSSTTSTSSTQVDVALQAALDEYSMSRKADLEAICELALENYTEMRSHVLTPMHHLRRHIDAFLTFLIRPSPQKDVSLGNPFPTPHVAGWTSLYSMVTFRPDVGYAEALRKERSQKKVVAGLGWIGATGLGVAAVAVGFRAWRTWAQRA